jgi:hypothetical protein
MKQIFVTPNELNAAGFKASKWTIPCMWKGCLGKNNPAEVSTWCSKAFF